jgi:hypothetical protein
VARLVRVGWFVAGMAAVALVAAAPGQSSLAQDDWAKKPFKQWTKAEAEKVLSDSPWARQQSVKIRVAPRSRRVAGAPLDTSGGSPAIASADLGGAEAPVDFTFTLRLRSSLRVREALVRLKQIEANYDKMNAARQAEFDAQPRIKGLLDCPACAENYVLTLSAGSSESPGADPVFATFKGARLADLQRYVYIADERGERRQLVHFVPPKAPGDEATFFFPRADAKGAPLLTPASRELYFNLSDMEVNSVTNFRVEVSKLVSGGAVDF